LVESNTLLVDWVLATSQGNDTRPRDGETVALGSSGLQELNILMSSVVGVAGDRAGASVGNFTWNSSEGIPDGRSTTVLCSSSLNLVAICVPLAR
jgi:hypothetical protein